MVNLNYQIKYLLLIQIISAMKRNLHFLQFALILVLFITGCQSSTQPQYSPETLERITAGREQPGRLGAHTE